MQFYSHNYYKKNEDYYFVKMNDGTQWFFSSTGNNPLNPLHLPGNLYPASKERFDLNNAFYPIPKEKIFTLIMGNPEFNTVAFCPVIKELLKELC